MKLKEFTTRAVGASKLFLKRNSPTILVIAAGVGAAAAIVMACFATKKVDKVLEPTNKKIEDLKEQLNNAEKGSKEAKSLKRDITIQYGLAVLDITKLYLPTIILYSASMVSMLTSHRQMTNRNVALAAAYTTIQNAFDAYRDRVKGAVGEELEDKLYRNVHKKVIEKTTYDEFGNQLTKTEEVEVEDPNNKIKFYVFDRNNVNFERNRDLSYNFLLSTQKYLNDKLHAQGYLFLEDVYKGLSVDFTTLSKEQLQAAKILGWLDNVNDGKRDEYVSFGICDRAGNPTPAVAKYLRGDINEIVLEFNYDGDILTGRRDNKGKEMLTYSDSIIS